MDRRRQVRHEVQLPVELDWGTGVTHDMSVSGAYIEAPQFDLPVGESFNFSVTIGKAETGCWTLRCHGMAIRIEKQGDRIGIAASIDRFVEISSTTEQLETSH